MEQAEIAVEFPVVLFNGERQVTIGNIEIHPTLDFHKFRTMLKQMIGISYNNLTTYLVESRRPEIPSDRRKILITSKVDFCVLLKETNAYFLVVLKRSRRDRRRKTNNRNCVDLSPADLFDYRFDQNHETTVTTYIDESGKIEYWLHQMQVQRENNNINNNLMMHDLNNDDVGSFPSITEAYPMVVTEEYPMVITEEYPMVEKPESRELCEDCMLANRTGVKSEFHLCVYDEVVEGFFRSPAGPICRPR